MLEYMLVLFSDPKPLFAMKPEEMEKMAGAYYAFTQALQKEKALVDSWPRPARMMRRTRLMIAPSALRSPPPSAASSRRANRPWPRTDRYARAMGKM